MIVDEGVKSSKSLRPGTGAPLPEGDVGDVRGHDRSTASYPPDPLRHRRHVGGASVASRAGAPTCASRADGAARPAHQGAACSSIPSRVAEIARKHPLAVCAW